MSPSRGSMLPSASLIPGLFGRFRPTAKNKRLTQNKIFGCQKLWLKRKKSQLEIASMWLKNLQSRNHRSLMRSSRLIRLLLSGAMKSFDSISFPYSTKNSVLLLREKALCFSCEYKIQSNAVINKSYLLVGYKGRHQQVLLFSHTETGDDQDPASRVAEKINKNLTHFRASTQLKYLE